MKINAILIAVLLVLTLIGSITVLLKRNQELKLENSNLALNVKSLEFGVKDYKDKLDREHTVSIEQLRSMLDLENSGDSVTVKLLDVVKAAGIRKKDVQSLGYVETKIVHTTSVKYVPRDSTYDLSQRPHLIEIIEIKSDSLSRHLEIHNEQSLIHKTKRETIKPPKRFFLARWLQKKHDVTYVDIVNTNPLIKTTDQKFIIVNK